jgi:hypothetical protein
MIIIATLFLLDEIEHSSSEGKSESSYQPSGAEARHPVKGGAAPSSAAPLA